MIPKYFRSVDPTGQCPLSVSKELVKETASPACPCGNENCAADREYVGILDGISNGRASIVYTILGIAGVALAILFLSSGGNEAKKQIGILEDRLYPLQIDLEKLESQTKPAQKKDNPTVLSEIKAAVTELEKSSVEAIAQKDAIELTRVKARVATHLNSLRLLTNAIDNPEAGSGALAVNSKGLILQLNELKDDSELIIGEVIARQPSEVQSCEDFLEKLDDILRRARRLVANAGSNSMSSENAILKKQMDQNLEKLAAIQAELDKFSSPDPLPFEASEATLTVMATGDNANDLAVPLVAKWSGGTILNASDGNFYISGGNKGKIIVKPVTSEEGFSFLSESKTALLFTDSSPNESELKKIGVGSQSNRSVAEVVALDALTLLVNPSNSLSETTANEIFPLRLEAGKDLSNVRLKAANFGIPLSNAGYRSGEETALKDAQVISLGLFHKEGVNLRAKRLAVSGTKGITALKPSPFAIATEDYLYSFRVVAWTPLEASDSALSLIKFATSNEGQEIVSKQGYIDLRLTSRQENVQPEILAALGEAMNSKTVSSAIRISTNIRFETGKTSLDLKAQADLERLPQFVFEKYPNHKVIILGFTDSDGEVSVNMPLSKERALAVAQELRKAKVDASSTGLGSMFPVDNNETNSGKSKNRRAEVWMARP